MPSQDVPSPLLVAARAKRVGRADVSVPACRRPLRWRWRRRYEEDDLPPPQRGVAMSLAS